MRISKTTIKKCCDIINSQGKHKAISNIPKDCIKKGVILDSKSYYFDTNKELFNFLFEIIDNEEKERGGVNGN